MSVSVEKLSGAAFLPFPELDGMLREELSERFSLSMENAVQYGELIFVPGYNLRNSDGSLRIPGFCRDAMIEPFILRFDSIGEAASELKKIQRSWASCSLSFFRRSSLIQEKLPYINLKPRVFPSKIPVSEIGLFCLLDKGMMLASAKTSSLFPAGRISFVEDHENPPSRAYLKLQESLTLAQTIFGCSLPSADSRCFEAGACPGGWTYVLLNLGCSVLAVDRSELAPSLMKNPLVEFRAHDAFTLKPEALGKFDWVFSDVICYPERLLSWIKVWLESGMTKKMICTIKMQGRADWNLISQFEEIPDSRVVHLNYNKHELTFIHCGKD
ncbi:SAM-dependent methyltransferase [Treponema sp.]|uniref:SAM-dependent methyltransferase n=1 Tax=Treponema sp. TaxID=166 RepID=UPI003F091AD6